MGVGSGQMLLLLLLLMMMIIITNPIIIITIMIAIIITPTCITHLQRFLHADGRHLQQQHRMSGRKQQQQ